MKLTCFMAVLLIGDNTAINVHHSQNEIGYVGPKAIQKHSIGMEGE